MRLAALQLLDKLQACYGLRMLEIFKEADLYNSLLRMYPLYPYNDMAMLHITSIIANAIDPKLVSEVKLQFKVPKKPNRFLELERIDQGANNPLDGAEESKADAAEDEQTRRD